MKIKRNIFFKIFAIMLIVSVSAGMPTIYFLLNHGMDSKILAIGIFLLFLILLALFSSSALAKNFIGSIAPLKEMIENIKKEQYNYHIESDSEDEFGDLAKDFNVMAEKIKETRERDELVNQMKSEFISIAAHQLRTPLTGMKWAMEAILNGDVGELSPEQKSVLEKGYLSNEKIIRLINDLLNVSRIEEGRFGFVFKNSSFFDVLNDVLRAVDGIITKKKIIMQIEKPDRLPLIPMDHEKMELAIMNIVDNALKYTPEYGKVIIKVGISNGKLKISIKDNGVGIPRAEKDRIFSKFFRGSNVMRMQAEGTGLGLFIVKNIIESHKGEVKIKSEENDGTEVIVYLPLKH